ncbi:NUDIX domain-containing protein [candidate division KSB1 bacterium]
MDFIRDKNVRIRAAAIIIEEKKILLVKHKKNDKEYWLLPGGGVKYGESLVNALKRELFEELNLKVDVKDIVYINDSINIEEERHIVNVCFRCLINEGKIKINKDHRLVGYNFIAFEKIQSLQIYPNIKQELIDYLKNDSSNKSYLGERWEE